MIKLKMERVRNVRSVYFIIAESLMEVEVEKTVEKATRRVAVSY